MIRDVPYMRYSHTGLDLATLNKFLSVASFRVVYHVIFSTADGM